MYGTVRQIRSKMGIPTVLTVQHNLHTVKGVMYCTKASVPYRTPHSTGALKGRYDTLRQAWAHLKNNQWDHTLLEGTEF